MCTACKSAGETACIYDKPASIAYVRYLEKQIKELSRTMEDSGLGEVASSIIGERIPDVSLGSGGSGEGGSNVLMSKSDPPTSADPNLSPFSGSEGNISPTGSRQSPSGSGKSFGIKIEDDSLNASETILSNPTFFGKTKQYCYQYLEIFNKKTSELEETALRSILQIHFGYIPLTTAKKCLETYWAWVHPIHLTLHRATFVRDMAAYSPLNPYKQHSSFSLALLSGIFSETLPLLYGKENELAKITGQHAQSLFMQDILFPATLATVTTALHRAISSIKNNNLSQLWIFSGISYRLAEDIDLYIRPEEVDSSISIECVEARSRLAWALFHWDKNISLYLGRLPSIPHAPFPLDEYIIDYTNDNEIWTPVIEPKGNKLLSAELVRLATSNNYASTIFNSNLFDSSSTGETIGNTSAVFGSNRSSNQSNISLTLKRSVSGSFKSDKGKFHSQGRGPTMTKIAPSAEHQPAGRFSESMKFKFKTLAIVNDVLICIFGVKTMPLFSGSSDLFHPPLENISNVQQQRLRELHSLLFHLWDQAPSNIKINEKYHLSVGIVTNPTNIANCLQYHACYILIYNYLLYGETISGFEDEEQEKISDHPNVVGSQIQIDINNGLCAVEKIIQALAIYIDCFGEFHTNHWHEYAPYISAQYLLALLLKKKQLDSKSKSRTISYLQSLLKLFQRPIFQIPKSNELISRIKNVTTESFPFQEQQVRPVQATQQSQPVQVQQVEQHQQAQQVGQIQPIQQTQPVQPVQHMVQIPQTHTIQQVQPIQQVHAGQAFHQSNTLVQPHPFPFQQGETQHYHYSPSHVQINPQVQSDINLNPFVFQPSHPQFTQQHQVSQLSQLSSQFPHNSPHIPPQSQHQTPQIHSNQHPLPVLPTTIYQNQMIGSTASFPRPTSHHSHHLSASAINLLTLEPQHEASPSAGPSNTYKIPGYDSTSQIPPDRNEQYRFKAPMAAAAQSSLSQAQFSTSSDEIHNQHQEDRSQKTQEHNVGSHSSGTLDQPLGIPPSNESMLGTQNFARTYNLSSPNSPSNTRQIIYQADQNVSVRHQSHSQHQDPQSLQLPSSHSQPTNPEQGKVPEQDSRVPNQFQSHQLSAGHGVGNPIIAAHPSYPYNEINIQHIGEGQEFLGQFGSSTGDGNNQSISSEKKPKDDQIRIMGATAEHGLISSKARNEDLEKSGTNIEIPTEGNIGPAAAGTSTGKSTSSTNLTTIDSRIQGQVRSSSQGNVVWPSQGITSELKESGRGNESRHTSSSVASDTES